MLAITNCMLLLIQFLHLSLVVQVQICQLLSKVLWVPKINQTKKKLSLCCLLFDPAYSGADADRLVRGSSYLLRPLMSRCSITNTHPPLSSSITFTGLGTLTVSVFPIASKLAISPSNINLAWTKQTKNKDLSLQAAEAQIHISLHAQSLAAGSWSNPAERLDL